MVKDRQSVDVMQAIYRPASHDQKSPHRLVLNIVGAINQKIIVSVVVLLKEAAGNLLRQG